MRKNFASLILVPAVTALVVPAAMAADNNENKDWQDQETWTQFTEKERANAFRMSTPKPTPKRAPTVLESVLGGQQPAQAFGGMVYQTAPQPASGNFTVPAYVCMPGQNPVQQPIQQVETVITPVVRRTALPYPPFGYGPANSWGYNGWGAHRYWGGAWGQPVIGFQKTTRMFQTGPSKASGNFYMPSTPDPNGSGNYYAPPTAPPVAMPVINREPDPRDFWGKTGSPLPADQQTQ